MTYHRNNGTLIRYVAITLVCVQHGFMLVSKPDPFGRYGIPWIGHVGVLIFFALSGYLLAPRILSERLGLFIANRVFRILPMLLVVNLLTVLLGALLTTLSFHSYVNDNPFSFIYSNILSFGRASLPGVVIGPHNDGHLNLILNITQWSVFYEMRAYLFLLVMQVLGVLSDRRIFNALVLVAICSQATPSNLLHLGDVRAYDVTLLFIFGILLSNGTFTISISFSITSCTLLLLLVWTHYFCGFDIITWNFEWVFICFLLAASIIGLGFTQELYLPFFDRLPDLTYVIYLIQWPIALLLTKAGLNHPFGLILSDFVISTLVALPLHFFIEEPLRVLPRRLMHRSLASAKALNVANRNNEDGATDSLARHSA